MPFGTTLQTPTTLDIRRKSCATLSSTTWFRLVGLQFWAVMAGFVGACTHIYVALTAIPLHTYGAFRVSRCLRVPIVALAAIEIVMLTLIANTLASLLPNNRAGRALKQVGYWSGQWVYQGTQPNTSIRQNQCVRQLRQIAPLHRRATKRKSQRQSNRCAPNASNRPPKSSYFGPPPLCAVRRRLKPHARALIDALPNGSTKLLIERGNGPRRGCRFHSRRPCKT